MTEPHPAPGKHRAEPPAPAAATPAGPSEALSLSVNRRTVLIGAGAAGLIGYAAGGESRSPLLEPVGYFSDTLGGADTYFDVVRADDSLVLRFRLFNMELVPGSGGEEPYLGLIDTSRPAGLIVDFTPQSVGEETSPLTAAETSASYDSPPNNDAVTGFRARSLVTPIPTRLAFTVGVPRIRPSLESANGVPGLLSWESFTPNLVGLIDSLDYTGPSPLQTQIGAPYGLGLSPDPNGAWVHSETPVVHSDLVPTSPPTHKPVTEIWQTRLGERLGGILGISPFTLEYPAVSPQARAVTSASLDLTLTNRDLRNDNGLFADATMTPGDRQDLVRLTSDGRNADLTDAFRYVPTPVNAHRLILSSAGAALELYGQWNPAPDIRGAAYRVTTSSWRHRASQGRDHQVVITKLGYLLPFGHPVALVVETDRRFEAQPTKYPMANLRTKTYLVIRQPVRDFGPGSGSLYPTTEDRDLPFIKVRLNTRATPPLTFRTLNDSTGQPVAGARVCLAEGKPFAFDVTAWDHEGHPVGFSMPMVFVTDKAASVEAAPAGTPDPSYSVGPDSTLGDEAGTMAVIRDAYNRLADLTVLSTNYGVSSAALRGQPVAVAPRQSPGDTTARFDAMVFAAVAPDSAGASADHDLEFIAADQIRSHVSLDHGLARIPVVQAISPGAASVVRFAPSYAANGFPDTTDQNSVFLLVQGQPLDFNGGGNTVGGHPGIATPNLSVGALSRNLGVVGGDSSPTGGVTNLLNNTFDPTAYLSDAKLLGGLQLAAVLATGISGKPPKDDPNAKPVLPPKILSRYVYKQFSGVDDPRYPILRTTLDWNPPMKTGPAGLDVFVADASTDFKLHAQIDRPLGTDPPSSDVRGSLKNFTLKLFGSDPFLIMVFDEFSFHAGSSAKPTMTPHVRSVTFAGPLAFIQELAPLLAKGDGNGITFAPTAITAKYSVAVPSISVGVFALTNLRLSLKIDIPFLDKPTRVRFALSSRESPFHLSLMSFTGGGSVALALGTDGLESLEVTFEFGASMSMVLGPVSGSLEVTAGVYFAIKPATAPQTGEAVELTGFVKAHGSVNLGPIGVAVTFRLSLSYTKNGLISSAYGQVTVHVEVHLIFFNGGIDFTARKEFAGGSDPGFADTLTFDQYQTYARAFA